MASVASTYESDLCRDRAVTVSNVHSPWWLYWLPVIVIGWGFYVADHENWHAVVATGDEEIDLVLDLSDRISTSSVVRQLGFASIGLVGGMTLLVRPRIRHRVDRRLLGAMLLLAVWTLSSALWADETGTSLRRSMLPALMFVAALGIARHWTPDRICLMAVHLGLTYVVVGIVAELQVGTFLQGDNYRFSGTLHPNSQAIGCMAVMLGSVCLYLGGSRFRRIWLMIAAFALAMLLLTGSRTGFFSLVAAMFVLFAWRASVRQRIYLLLGGGTMACVVLLGSLLMADADLGDSMLDVARMGREQDVGEVSSLTGRIPIWTELARHIAYKPVLGFGYGCFWTGQRVYALSTILNWEFNHAHSVYLEALLNVGMIGLAIGIVVAFVGTRRALAAAGQTGDIGYQFTLVWLLTGMIHGLAETSFIQPGFAAMLGMIGLSLLVFRERPTAEPSS